MKTNYLEIKEKEKPDKKHSFNKEIYFLHFLPDGHFSEIILDQTTDVKI